MAKLSKAQFAELTQFIFDGFSTPEIAFYFDLSLSTVKRIKEGVEEPNIRKAVLKMKAHYISQLRDTTGKNFARIAWFLERRYPKEFARPEVQLSMSEHLTTNNTLIVSAEVAEAILKRSKAITTEIDTLLDAKRPPASEASEPSDAA